MSTFAQPAHYSVGLLGQPFHASRKDWRYSEYRRLAISLGIGGRTHVSATCVVARRLRNPGPPLRGNAILIFPVDRFDSHFACRLTDVIRNALAVDDRAFRTKIIGVSGIFDQTGRSLRTFGRVGVKYRATPPCVALIIKGRIS